MALVCFPLSPVQGADRTWNGGAGGNDNWSAGGAGGNWGSAAAPVNGDSVGFTNTNTVANNSTINSVLDIPGLTLAGSASNAAPFFNGALGFNHSNNQYHNLDLGGNTLTTTGHFYVGQTVNGTALVTIRNGALVIGNDAADVLHVGRANGPTNNNARGVLDLSQGAGATLTTNVGFIRIGVVTGGDGSESARGQLILGHGTNNIAATNILISDSENDFLTSQPSSLTFGAGINNVTDPLGPGLFKVGGAKGDGTATIAAGGTLNLGTAGNRYDLLRIGYNDSNNTSSDGVGLFDMSGGTFNAFIDELTIGFSNTSNATGSGTGTFTMTAGAVDVNTVNLAQETASGSAAGTLNLLGGTFTVQNNIAESGNLATSTITLDGSTLDMTGGNITVDTFNIRSGALQNVNQLTIGGSPNITKTTSGTLTLGGTNAFTGNVGVSAGSWLVDGVHNNAGNYSVASGATLGGSGTINLAGANQVAIAAGAFLSPGAGYSGTSPASLADIGTLSINGTGPVVGLEGTLQIDILSPSSFDILDLNGNIAIDSSSAVLEVNGQTDFSQLDFIGDLGFSVGDRVDLISSTGVTGDFSNFAFNQSFFDAGDAVVFFGNDGANVYFELISQVPEPASIAAWVLVACVALAGARRASLRRASAA